MHEAKLCLSLLALAERSAAEAGAARILAVELAVGEWSGCVPEALAAAFPICAQGTKAAGAALRIERVPGVDLVLRALEVS
ncbi:MAG: hydrogenase maturation nickel metallochaperone HypA [Deltaproteobacteria bacterium]|nr:hydrogenase maturation nickel metallochaperone HypA [Deltaproteobacteria bacterium]